MNKESRSDLSVDTHALSDIIDATARRRRGDLGCVSLAEAEGFDCPTFFTAAFNYFATGEGHTMGVVMGYAHSATQLNENVVEDFGAYHSAGAEIWPQLLIPPEGKSLIPDLIRTVISDPSQVVGNFHFFSTYHLNQS